MPSQEIEVNNARHVDYKGSRDRKRAGNQGSGARVESAIHRCRVCHSPISSLPFTDAAWQSHVQRFLQKQSLKSRKAYGESGDADTAAAEQFFANEWPGIFSSVDNNPSRVRNMAETGLFWRALSRRILARADEKLEGSKTQKDRITFAATTAWMGLGYCCMALGTRSYLVLLLQLTPLLLLFSIAAGLVMQKHG